MSSDEVGNAIEWNNTEGSREYWLKEHGIESKETWLTAMHEHLATLRHMADSTLAPGTTYEIRVRIPSDFGREIGVAWYSNGEMQGKELVAEKRYPGELDKLGGFMLLERRKTPERL